METGNLYFIFKKHPKLLGIINPYGLSKHMCANMIPKNHLSFSHVKLLWQDQHKDVWRSGKIATLALCLTCAATPPVLGSNEHSTLWARKEGARKIIDWAMMTPRYVEWRESKTVKQECHVRKHLQYLLASVSIRVNTTKEYSLYFSHNFSNILKLAMHYYDLLFKWHQHNKAWYDFLAKHLSKK